MSQATGGDPTGNRDETTGGGLDNRIATALVFFTSACVLVLEILAGRLLAPIIGISLETFTGIIGTVLAGIALGNAVGGWLADERDPAPLIGPTLIVGGALTWLAPPIASAMGGQPAGDPVTIVFLAAITFFAPATVLSAITPMVAKLQLDSLEQTGRIVGNLSAAGTVGALTGTFLTGFVLVTALGTRTLIVAVGALLVAVGLWFGGWRWLSERRALAAVAVIAGLGSALLPSPCDAETAYSCVQIEVDPERPSGRALVLDSSRNSYVDLEDPGHLEFRYMRVMDDVIATSPPGPLAVGHVGGAGFTMARRIESIRAGSDQTIFEIDAELVDVVAEELDDPTLDDVAVEVGDARLTLADQPTDSFDVLIGDAYSGLTVPWHLTTVEFAAELDRILRPDGVVVANVIDGGRADFVRAELATLARVFDHVVVVAPPDTRPDDDPLARPGRNFIVVASDRPVSMPDVASGDGSWFTEPETRALFADREPLTDDFAPVDQLRRLR